MSPEQRERLRQRYQRFKQLREKWQSMTPEQRQRFREQRIKRWQQQDEGG